ncbi:hypothetical protein D9M72_547480 [compost metagenome]
MVIHIFEEGFRIVVDAREFEVAELSRHFPHRSEDSLKADHLATHAEDAPDLLRLQQRHEHVFLEFQNFVLERLDHRQVAVDNEVNDAVKDVVGTVFEKPWGLLELLAQFLVGAG